MRSYQVKKTTARTKSKGKILGYVSLVLFYVFLMKCQVFVRSDRLFLFVLYCVTAYSANPCLRLSANGDNLTASRAANCLRLSLAIKSQGKECSIRGLNVTL